MELRVWPQKPSHFFENRHEKGYYRERRGERDGIIEGDCGDDIHERYVPFGLDDGGMEESFDTQRGCGPSLPACYSHMQCNDFEERGFCLLGDMCPMEHGVNKIVVEDVHSLRQYNLELRPSSSEVSENGEVTGAGGGEGSTDSYDPDHPLLCLKISSPTKDGPRAVKRTATSRDMRRKTVYVGRIPRRGDRREALLSHFSRFGHVSGIHIPPGRDEAFVRFSQREEAEAALRAPDALMGNRFVILKWAKRDCFPDIDALPMQPTILLQAAAERGAEQVRKKQKGVTLEDKETFDLQTQFDDISNDENSPGDASTSLRNCSRTIFDGISRSQLRSSSHAKSFSIIPPLPPEFSDVAVLKKHFSRFGKVLIIEMDDVDFRESTRVTFSTRPDAERAFTHGCYWNGNILRFAWHIPSSPSR